MIVGGIGDSPIDYGGATDVDSGGSTSTADPIETGIPAWAPDAGLDTGSDDQTEDVTEEPEPAPDPDDPSTAPSATGAPQAGDDAGATLTVDADGEVTYESGIPGGDSDTNSGGTSTSDGGGTEETENVVESDGGGGNNQSDNEVSDDRIDQLLDQMEASSEQAAVVPVPLDGSSGLTATGVAAAVVGAGALYLAFAGGS